MKCCRSMSITDHLTAIDRDPLSRSNERNGHFESLEQS